LRQKILFAILGILLMVSVLQRAKLRPVPDGYRYDAREEPVQSAPEYAKRQPPAEKSPEGSGPAENLQIPSMVAPLSQCADFFSPECSLAGHRLITRKEVISVLIAASEYAIYAGTTDKREMGIFRLNVATRASKLLADFTSYPLVSPGRQYIAYDQFADKESPDALTTDIWLMDASGGNRHPVTDDGRSRIIRWLGSGEMLIAKVKFSQRKRQNMEDDWLNWKKLSFARINAAGKMLEELSAEPPLADIHGAVSLKYISGAPG